MNTTASLPQTHVLVVDDEPDLRVLYQLTLLREGHQVESAANLQEAWQLLERQAFDAVITDMRLPDGLGLDLLRGMAERQRPERCIVMTAYGSADNAVEALKAGAFDYLTKPVDLKQFRAVVASAVSGLAQPRRLNKGKAAQPQRTDPAAPSAPIGATVGAALASDTALARLAGESSAMRSVKERIVKVARSMAPVLVHGESGTGKELVAQAIHACSHRASGPFVAVNCGAIPENLLEAEFFGSKKGAYTGAAQDRLGYFQAAQGGTLFLDEIGDLPLTMQAKLLRAIQERRVRPLGSTQEDQIDVRIVSATHKDLGAETHAGRFRQDLYYRLNVIDIVIPPLRERRSDLPALCNALLARIALEAGQNPPYLAPQALDCLAHQPLLGNVRELENLLHRAMALHEGGLLTLDFAKPAATPNTESRPDQVTSPAAGSATPVAATADVYEAPLAAPVAVPIAAGDSLGTPLPRRLPLDLQAHLDEQERGILVWALQETRFNRTSAAAQLGISLRQIRYRIARLNILTPHSDDADPAA
jgi:two-component system, NtrC family, response regulator PilR